MRNRMQDLDFEQTVAFDSVKDFEFTRKAAQKFRQVVSLDSFEDEDADVIFHYLYKEMELVSFGDYLKRYVYERAELEEPFSQVPQEVYREIVVESFKETYTPKSMSPTSAKLSSLVNNWLTQASVKRETVFLLGFGLRMSTEDVSDFLTRVLREQDFDFHNPEEVIYWYCYRNHLGYYKAEEYKETYKQMTPVEKKTGEIVYGTGLCLDSEEKLLEYLAFLKGRHDDPKSEKSQAFQEFMILPVGAENFKESIRMGTEVFHSLKEILTKKGFAVTVGDEGGFAPDVADAFEVFELLMEAVITAGYKPGEDIYFAMDAAASELYNTESGLYEFPREYATRQSKVHENVDMKQQKMTYDLLDTNNEMLAIKRDSKQLVDYYSKIIDKFPVISIEDPLNEEDWDGWRDITDKLGNRVQLVGRVCVCE